MADTINLIPFYSALGGALVGGLANYIFNLTIATRNKKWERNQRNSVKLEDLYESVEFLSSNYHKYLSLINIRSVTKGNNSSLEDMKLEFPSKPLMLIGLYLPELKSVEEDLLALYGNLMKLEGDSEMYICVGADEPSIKTRSAKISDLRHQLFDTFESIFKKIKDLANSKGFTQP